MKSRNIQQQLNQNVCLFAHSPSQAYAGANGYRGTAPAPPLGSVKFMASTGAERPLEKFKPPPPRQISEYSPFHHACHLFSQFNIAQTIMSGTAMKRALYRFLQYTFRTLQKFSPAKCYKFLFFNQQQFLAVLELIVKIMFLFYKILCTLS